MEKQMELEHIDVNEGRSAAMPNVEGLLQILIESNQQQAAQSVAFMLDFMDRMEEQLETVNQELKAVRGELNHLQNTPETKTLRARLSRWGEVLETKVQELQERINQTKAVLNEKAGQVINDFKQRGIRALDNVTKVLAIKPLATALHDVLKRQAISMEGSIDSINQTEKRYRESVHHVKNAGRAIRGKEAEKEINYPEKGVFAAMRGPYQQMHNLYSRGIAQVNRLLSGIDKLEKAGVKAKVRKVSISQKLKQFKEKQIEADKQSVPDVGQKIKPKVQDHGR